MSVGSAERRIPPVTEQRNPATDHLDQLGAGDAIRTMRHVEREILNGLDGASGLMSVAEDIAELANRIAHEVLSNGLQRICISGSGTSGRLCYLTSVLCEQIFGTNLVQYNINGGLNAFARSKVGIEDSYEKGVHEILSISDAGRASAFLAVSCGFSAPYIAGQLGAAVRHLSGPVVAMGFNPRSLARTEVRDSKHISFSETLDICSSYSSFSILDPVVGPEAIAGSVRLKAGSATMISLFALAACVHKIINGEAFNRLSFVQKLIMNAVESIDLFYDRNGDLMEEVLCTAIESIRADSSLHLLSNSAYGLLMVADCAECPPTFGARYDEFIGYCPVDAFDLGCDANIDKEAGPPIPIKNGYKVNFCSEPSGQDTSIVFGNSASLWSEIKYNPNLKLEIKHFHNFPKISKCLNAEMASDRYGDFIEFFNFVQIKSFLNCISTLSFSLTGKVYKNVMVDLRISNAKLLDRSVSIVSELCSVDLQSAYKAILQSIYEDMNVAEFENRNILNHVFEASKKEKIIQKAIFILKHQKLPIESVKNTPKNKFSFQGSEQYL